MSGFKVTLLGKFNVERENQEVVGIKARKVQELFSYLLLSRNRPQPRESLCELLWGNQPPSKSKKYLRQALWRLQSALKDTDNSFEPEILADDNWIQISPSAGFWLDVAEFERAFNSVNGKNTRELILNDFNSVQYAITLYKGDLLEGWYQDWCLFERERFQVMYLMLLEKLVQYCEFQGHYDAGLAYGTEILRHDRASERAHRQMMRLYCMAGDRTQALHQYKRCEAALRNGLEVEPSALTKQLYEQIRLDTFSPSSFRAESVSPEVIESALTLSDMLNQFERFSNELVRIQVRIKNEITALESILSAPK